MQSGKLKQNSGQNKFYKKMEREDEVNDELRKIAPGFPENKSIDSPQGYFETFPDRILKRWQEEKAPPGAKKTEWRRLVGIAAILTGLWVVAWWLFLKTPLKDTPGITAIEAYQYIEENIDDFEGLIEAEEIKMDDNRLDIPQEAIEEYLIEELEETDPEDLF